jgi:hypothetical protein
VEDFEEEEHLGEESLEKKGEEVEEVGFAEGAREVDVVEEEGVDEC